MPASTDVKVLVKGPKEAYLTLAEKGALTCKESSAKIFGQSFIAGCYIGFGAFLAVVISSSIPGLTKENPGLKSFVFATLFPVNLVLILLTGGILFTGTSAACPAAVLERKASLKDTARCLVLSWIGNVLGSMTFAAFTVLCELDTDDVTDSLTAIALKKTSKSFFVTFLRGIGCNWMVCMAVFLSGQAQDMVGKVVAIYLPISTFVMCGFEHIPANFYLLGLALLTSDKVNFVDILTKNWIPVTLGNFVAGAFIVACSYSFFFGRLGHNGWRGNDEQLAIRAAKSMGFGDMSPVSSGAEKTLKKDDRTSGIESLKRDFVKGDHTKPESTMKDEEILHVTI